MTSKLVVYYTVKPNDTIWTIAQRYQTTIQAIQLVNPQIDLNLIRVGQKVRICPPQSSFLSTKSLGIISTFHRLWEEHALWTRMAINSILLELPDESLVVERLLKNPHDFEEALRPFYGEAYTNRLSALLTNHLQIALDFVKATKAGNTDLASTKEIRWYQNALELALFLSQLNPYFNHEEWRQMLFDHLRLVKEEANYLLTNEYAKGIATYDEMASLALDMANEMSNGIIRQFQIP